MFGRKNKETETPVTTEPEVTDRDPQAGKGAPTPKRSVQQAQNKRPLVPSDRKLSKEQKIKEREERQRQFRLANETADERYLLPKDRGEQKRFARAFVDARYMFSEYLMFVLLAFIIVALLIQDISVQSYITLAMWAVLLITVVDTLIMTRKLKKRLLEKFGTVERGVLWYAATRGMQFRKLRLPKPQVARGEHPQ
ncbi:DUF3043 domain-containing protein [Neomicrococcus aestuarii]|uniref:Magnesium-transporting ATPase (P-type) n=1 Tax=Neomicrococcus aestuarii TaxID=556325 RepID=A0A1L2ZLM0_9MICC|nr:DUF3043 domain-containing protein [Neomicrococcus aestuarii]APF40099.1 hypothetical protein BHE16_02640 [Neomicrococcus aestuarii]MBB5511931.1 magnesium-transporting ATPase (P-type) [Neomicrococcus aestuarii]